MISSKEPKALLDELRKLEQKVSEMRKELHYIEQRCNLIGLGLRRMYNEMRSYENRKQADIQAGEVGGTPSPE